MENIGNAEAREVRPTFNLCLDNKPIATITTQQDAYSLKPEGRYPEGGVIVIDKDENGDKITLSLDQLKAIMMGAPLSIEVTQVSAKICRWDNEKEGWAFGGEWTYWSNQIEASCIKLLVDTGQNEHSCKYYSIFVGDENFNPSFNLRQVLSFANLIEERDGKTYIDGCEFTSEWLYGTGSSVVNQEWQNKVDNGEDPLNFVISKDMGCIAMIVPNENTKPKINWALFSNDQRTFRISISPGVLGIADVEARATVGGEVETRHLDALEGSLEYNNTSSPFSSSVKDIELIITDNKGNESKYQVSQVSNDLYYGDKIFLRVNFPVNRWLTGGRDIDNFAVYTRDGRSGYEASVPGHYEWIVKKNLEDTGTGKVSYGDKIFVSVQNRWDDSSGCQ